MTYEQVIFLQGDQANEALEIEDNEGYEAAINYLTQWHYPGEHETRADIGNGTTDRLFEKDGYTLIINRRFGYIGLVYKKETE